MLFRPLALSFLMCSFIAAIASACDGCGGPQPAINAKKGAACAVEADCTGALQCITVNTHQTCTDPNDLDGDGIPNAQDTDIDGDGTPNALDGDIDGDGTPNVNPDGTKADPTPFGDNNLDPATCIGPQGDCDNDGVPNSVDNDDDGDGVPDGVRGDGSCDGGATTIHDQENADCDGYCITVEGGFQPCNDCPAGTDPVNCAAPGAGVGDTDGDGIPDPIDPDPNGDGDQPPLITGEGEGEGAAAGEGEGEGGGQNCTTSNFQPGQNDVQPRILFVVDKSGSMGDDDLAGQQKYDACRQAIEAVTGGLNGTVDMGLMTFPDDDQCAEGSLKVNVAAGTAGQIANVLDNTSPGGGTPTAVSLLGAKQALDALPTAGGPRVVVIATDGGPNCNESLNGDTCRCVSNNGQQDCQNGGQTNCLDDSNTISAAQQLNASGYPVFVIGEHGSENFTDVLNSLAVAGGTDQPGSIKFYAANNSTDLQTDLQDIAIRVGACRIDLAQNVTPGQVSVTVNGNPVSQDTTRQNGWDLVDPNTVELFGQPCIDTVNGGASATVGVQVCDG